MRVYLVVVGGLVEKWLLNVGQRTVGAGQVTKHLWTSVSSLVKLSVGQCISLEPGASRTLGDFQCTLAADLKTEQRLKFMNSTFYELT